MTAEIYQKLKNIGPRLRSYKRESSAVRADFMCSSEYIELVKELSDITNEVTIFSNNGTFVWFTVRTADEDFTENLVRDFLC